MKSKDSLIKDAIMLFLITLISGLALSFVFEITKAPIAEQKALKLQKANQAVFVTADSFETDEGLMAKVSGLELGTLDGDYEGITIDEVSKALNSEGELLGYNVSITTKQSYDDSLSLVFGYSKAGVIQGIAFTSLTETAGLGMKAADPAFIGQFLNKDVRKFNVTKTGAASEDQIDAISGATITSRAVANAVNAGISFVTEYSEEFGGGR
ncbi:MAG TPA: FMN-binding protein [Clostridiales bacterium]|nr:FMN-binding protein [Clostridiales bacterium]